LAERLLDRSEHALGVVRAVARTPAAAREPGSPARDPERRGLATMSLAFGLARRPPPLAPIT
jgi:hypothetical protein